MSNSRIVITLFLMFFLIGEINRIVEINQSTIATEVNDSNHEDSETEKKSENQEFDHNQTILSFLLIPVEVKLFSTRFLRNTEHIIGIYSPPPELS